MSRNARQKLPHTPAPKPKVKQPKPKKRRVSDTSTTSFDISDEGGYSAVEDISESEDDDEEHVYAAEEEHIISHEAHRGQPRTLPPQQDVEDDADEEDDDDDEAEEHVKAPEEVEQAEDDDDDDDLTDAGSWDGILSSGDEAVESQFTDAYHLDPNVANVERHVRFTGVPDSDSDSTTTDTTEDVGGFFPDIFVEQASLDPAFRREIEYDPDESSNSGGSFWDFGSHDRFEADSDDEAARAQGLDDDTPTPTPNVSQVPTVASTPAATSPVQELDGYESECCLVSDTVVSTVLMPPCQLMATQRKTMSPNRRSVERWSGVFSLWISLLIPTRSDQPANAVSLAWGGITSTARIGNLLPYSIPYLGR